MTTPPSAPISEERLRNTLARAKARIGSLSGAEVIVGAIDELIEVRKLLAERGADAEVERMREANVTDDFRPCTVCTGPEDCKRSGCFEGRRI